MSVLTADHLTIGYPRRTVARDLALTLEPGELVCLLGPNGAGKSTLMRTLAGMHPPLAGKVLLQGENVARLPARELAKRLSVVLTEHVDVGAISGRELVELGRYPYTDWMSRQTDRDRRAVRWALEAVDGLALAERSLHELSDGERQKMYIARALAQEPAVMMLDEPTAFLDLPRRVEIMHLLRTLARETRRAILLSTHDLDLALRNADRVWLLSKSGELHVGAPEDLVLNGAFEKAFAGAGAAFDVQSGAFVTQIERRGAVSLVGEGVAALWTARALEREGYAIEPLSDTVVRVMDAEGQAQWHARAGGVETDCASIYTLLAFLNKNENTAPNTAPNAKAYTPEPENALER